MKKRLLSVDFMRGVAVVTMIEIHIWGSFIAQPLDPLGHALKTLSAAIGGNAAELFAFVSGLSASLLVSSYSNRGHSNSTIQRFMLARGAFLFLLSTAINIIAGPVLHILDGPILNWTVIQLIGCCLVFAPAFKWSSWIPRLLWILLPWALLAWVYPAYPWLSPLFSGVAPVFPWSSLFFAGMWISDYFFAERGSAHQSRKSLVVFCAGVLLAGPITYLFSVMLNLPPAWIHGNEVNLTSFTMLVGTFSVLLALCSTLLDAHRSSPSLLESAALTLSEMGKRSLTIYYIQLVGIVLIPILLQRIFGYPVRVHWVWFLPLVAFAIFIIYRLVNIGWKKYDYVFTIEWFMAKIVRKPSARAVQEI